MFLLYPLGQISWRNAAFAACLFSFLFLPLTSFASNGKLTLSWNSNEEADVAGYRLYYGTNSGSYTSHADVGLSTIYSLQGLEQRKYYFAITAYNQSGQESGYSNEIAYTVPAPPTISKISDTKGPSGMEVAISGSNLVNETVIEFAGIAAKKIRVKPGKVIVAVPQGVSSGPVTVTTPGGSVVAANFTATPAQSITGLEIPAGSAVHYSTIGPLSSFQAGYAMVTADGGTPPDGIALLNYSQGGAESSIIGLTAPAPTTSSRILVHHLLQVAATTGKVDVKTGFSIVNPGSGVASLELTLRDSTGRVLETETSSLAQGQHMARFADDLFTMPDRFGLGSLEIKSNEPVLVTAIRLTVNQNGKLLFSALPVVDMSQPLSNSPVYFPQMNTGGGFQTSVLLLNSSDQVETGRIVLLSPSGTIFSPRNPGSTPVMSSYRILPGGVFQMSTSPGDIKESGWIRVMPDSWSPTPAGMEFIRFTENGILSAETCLAASAPTYRALMYVGQFGDHESRIAIANPGSSPLSVQVRSLTGSEVAPSLQVPGNGTADASIDELLGDSSLREDSQGFIEFTSSQPFLPGSLGSFSNSEGALVLWNIPVLDPEVEFVSPSLIFPQVADGNGYQTDFVFLGSGSGSNPVQIGFWGSDASPIAIGR